MRFGNWIFAKLAGGHAGGAGLRAEPIPPPPRPDAYLRVLAGLPPPATPKMSFSIDPLPGGVVMRKNMTNVAGMLRDTLLSL
jgi:hypothetical protein